jgi:hypothetical protein
MSPISGSGTMTPITGGVPGAGTDIQPFPYTLLSIYRYARIMGITPLHFAGRGHHVLGVDASPNAIGKALAKSRKRKIKTLFLVMDALDLNVKIKGNFI